MAYRRASSVVVAAAILAVSGCSIAPSSERPDFTISGPEAKATAAVPGDAASADAGTTMATLARAYCADGYETGTTGSIPTESSQAPQWEIRCDTYSPRFLDDLSAVMPF